MKKNIKNTLLSFVVIATFLSASVYSFAEDNIVETDVCSNVSGTQTEVPGGYHLSDGFCYAINEDGMPTQMIEEVLVVDVCLNIDGVQEVIPEGYAKVQNGDCKQDLCKNISGNQFDIPTGYIRIDNTDCLPDVCPNLVGAQAKIPNNYWIGDGECRINIDIGASTKDGAKLTIPGTSGKYVYDACPNMWGIQGGVPAGYLKDTATNKCMPKPVVKIIVAPTSEQKDLCSNIQGVQTKLPKGLRRPEGSNICIER